MRYINSKDGIQLAYEQLGEGKPFIIIGGALADHQMYVPLASELAHHFLVFNYDRRNRGKSGISVRHTVERELEDVEVLISLCNEKPILYGHSAGAALSIRAAVKFDIEMLILSDLPFSPFTESSKMDTKKFLEERSKIVEFLNNNDKEAAVKYFLKDFGMSIQEMEQFISSANGKQAIANSTTLPVDYDVLGDGLTPTELLRKIDVPVLIITSDDGMAIAEDAAQYLKNCKIENLRSATYSLSASEIAKPIINIKEM